MAMQSTAYFYNYKVMNGASYSVRGRDVDGLVMCRPSVKLNRDFTVCLSLL